METLIALFLAWLAYAGIALVLIGVHEGGHLIAGRLVGFRWEFCQIGPFRISRVGTGKKLHVSIAHDRWVGGLAGVYPKDKFGSQRAWAFVYLGGSIANLLLCLVLFVIISQQPLDRQQSLRWLGSISLYSGVVGVLNLVPFRFRGKSSDGLRLLTFCLSGREYQRRRIQWERYQTEQKLPEDMRQQPV